MILRGLGYGGSLASAGFGAWATIGGSGVTISAPLITIVGGTYAPVVTTEAIVFAPVAGHVVGRVLPILSPGYILYIKSQKRLWYDLHTNTLHYVLSDGKTILLQD